MQRRDFLKSIGLALAALGIPGVTKAGDLVPEEQAIELGAEALLRLRPGDFIHMRISNAPNPSGRVAAMPDVELLPLPSGPTRPRGVEQLEDQTLIGDYVVTEVNIDNDVAEAGGISLAMQAVGGPPDVTTTADIVYLAGEDQPRQWSVNQAVEHRGGPPRGPWAP